MSTRENIRLIARAPLLNLLANSIAYRQCYIRLITVFVV